MFDFLKPAPDVPRIEDRDLIRKSYRRWRTRSMFAIFAGYIGYYLVRKSFTVAMPAIQHEFNISKTQMGLILTAFGVVYGVSKFFNGFAADRTNPRYFMGIGLVVSALINLVFGLSSGVVAFAAFWIFSGWFQGMREPASIRILVSWFSPKERGLWFSIANVACSLGAAGASLVMVLNGYLIAKYGWRSGFFVSAGVAFAISLFILSRLRDRPQSLGLPPVEEYRGEDPDIGETKEKGSSYKELLLKYIFLNPGIWIAGLANFFVCVVRFAVVDWGTTFLMESKGVDLTKAALSIGGYELGGFVGMVACGLMLDKVFKGYGGRLLAICMAFCTLLLFLFWRLPAQSAILNAVLLLGTGIAVYSSQYLVPVLVVNMVPRQVAAAAVGLTGLLGYMSTILSGWGMGAAVDRYGWEAGFFALVVSSLIGMFLFVLLWNSHPYRIAKQAR